MIHRLIQYYNCFLLITTLTQPLQATEQTPFLYQQTTIQNWLKKIDTSIKKTIFENGTTLLTYPIPNSCKVTIQVALNVGSKDEEPDELGFSHVIEHMLFKGTDTLSESDILAIAAKFGAGKIGEGFNAFTGFDNTHYLFNTDNQNWPIFLRILLDCTQNATMDESQLQSELKAIINELKIGEANSARCLYFALNRTVLHEDHPYHVPMIGTRKILFNATRDKIYAFYKKHYQPKNIIVIIAGDITHKEATEQVANLMNTKPSTITFSQKPKPCEYTEQRGMSQSHTIFYKDTPEPIISYTWKDAPVITSPELAAASCTANILDTRLNFQLVDDMHAARKISVFYSPHQLLGTIRINYSPLEDTTSVFDWLFKRCNNRTKCHETILDALKKLAHEGPTDKELIEFKNSTTVEALKSFESCEYIASVLASIYTATYDEHYLTHDLHAINALTKKDIQHFCNAYLRLIEMHTFECQPIPHDEKNTWLKQQTLLDNLDASRLNTIVRETEVEQPSLLKTLPQPKPLDWSFEKPDIHFTLDNGLNVYLKNDTSTPFIHLNCSFKNKENFSTALALNKQKHIKTAAMDQLTEGSLLHSKRNHVSFFQTLGTDCSFNEQGGTMECFAHTFKESAQRFVEILTMPAYTKKMFDQYREDTIQAIRIDLKHPNFLAYKAMQQYLFKAYPWIISPEEEIARLEKLKLDDLKFFHQTYVAPQNFNLVITGNFSPEALKQEIIQTFGNWQSPRAFLIENTQVTIADITNPPSKTFTQFWPKEQLVTLYAGRVGAIDESDDAIALSLLDMHINKELFDIREATGLFYSINAIAYNNTRNSRGVLLIQTQITPENLAVARTKITVVLEKIASQGITQENLETARYNATATIATNITSSKALCNAYSNILETNDSWNYFTKYHERLMHMSLETVNKVAARYYSPESWSFSIIGKLKEQQ